VSLKRSHRVKLPIRIANLAYWVTGTEGSNPSLSASQSAIFAFSAEKSKYSPRPRLLFDLRAPEKLRFGRQYLTYARFSLSRSEAVPSHLSRER